jgi:predicted ATPase/transcriptional regulator with XRE-family HTH domain
MGPPSLNFAYQLQQERLRRDWSQSQLAFHLKTTRVTIYRWEQGISVPSPIYWERLSRFLNVPIETFLVPADPPSDPLNTAELPPEEDSDEQSLLPLPEPSSEEHHLLLERERVALAEQHLALHHHYLQYVLDVVEKTLSFLDPYATQAVRCRTLELLFHQLEQEQHESNQQYTPISFSQVTHAFQQAKQEEALPGSQESGENLRSAISQVEQLTPLTQSDEVLALPGSQESGDSGPPPLFWSARKEEKASDGSSHEGPPGPFPTDPRGDESITSFSQVEGSNGFITDHETRSLTPDALPHEGAQLPRYDISKSSSREDWQDSTALEPGGKALLSSATTTMKRMLDHDSARKRNVPNQKLREARQQRGWTHKDVADQMGLPDSHTVGRWERGINTPSAYYCRELCRVFGKSAEKLGLIRSAASVETALEDGRSLEVFNNVPTFFTSFVGRQQEVVAVCSLLMASEVRLLTLYGTGGIGKTRLALEVAAQIRGLFEDGVCFVALAAVRDSEAVLPTLAATLGIEDSASISLEQQVKMVLHDKRLLLLLDTFEHVMSAASFLEELLAACPQVKVLVTSRQLLQLPAERAFAVPPLSLPDHRQPLTNASLTQSSAVALFLQRVQSYLPSFKMTEHNARAIAELCIRLDGLPLALELAAARIKLFSPQALLARLSQDWQILSSELRTTPERHRTLSYTIQWSYDLLTEQEQWLFRHLSIFVGGVSFDTIEAVFGTIIQPASTLLELVTSLLNKSLLQRVKHDHGEPRLVMSEQIRHYALNCLQEQGEREELEHAHASYYLSLVEKTTPSLKNSQQRVWLSKLEGELENLRAALHWLIEHQQTEETLRFCEGFGKFCGLQGYWREEQRWLHAALQLPHQRQQQGIRGRVLRRAGHLAYRLRELTEARVLLEESVACSREAGDLHNLVGALSSLGWVCYRLHEPEQTSQMLYECVEVAYQAEDEWVLANALESLGRWMRYQGKIGEAYALLQRSVAIARAHLDKESLARILSTQVTLEVAQGEMEQAMALAQESFMLAQELGTRPLIALTLDRLGEVALCRGAYQEAKEYFEERIMMAEELGDTPTIASKKLALADIALAEEDFLTAQQLVDEARDLLPQKDTSNDAIIACILGDMKRMEGDMIQARQWYLEGLHYYKRFGDKGQVSRCLSGFAHLLLDRGAFEDAAYLAGAAGSRLGLRDFHPKQRIDLQHIQESACSQLGEENFTRIWQQGFNASLEHVLFSLT